MEAHDGAPAGKSRNTKLKGDVGCANEGTFGDPIVVSLLMCALQRCGLNRRENATGVFPPMENSGGRYR